MTPERSLLDDLSEGPLPIPRAAVVATQLAAILRDRVGQPPHRQIGPEKVLVAWDGGQPIVTLLDPDGSAEVSYLAPEQWTGGTVDVRADIYATGALLFHMLQGVAPPRALERTRPLSLRGIPDELAVVCRQAMAEAPSARYSSGEALFDALAGAYAALRRDQRHSK